MACGSQRHREVDEHGIGKCSVPMRCMGMDAGHCDEPAYGKRPPFKGWTNRYTGERVRNDGKYNGYVPGLACPRHGGPDTRCFVDGNKWCAVAPDFVNLAESLAGFGDTPEDARNALEKAGVE